MIYLKRLLAVIAVLFSLVVFTVGFPFFAAVYIYSGKDFSERIIKMMPGK
jgi:hypothetical protein